MPQPIRPKDLIYALDERPPPAQLVLLGLQHVAYIVPYLVIVALIVRASGETLDVAHNAISLGMIALGAMTVLQSLDVKGVGSGYLAPPVVSAIYLPPCLAAADAGGLSLVYGLIVAAGLIEAAFAWVLLHVRQVFPPVISGFIVLAVGHELGFIGVKSFLDVAAAAHGEFTAHLAVAALTLSFMVGFSVWGRGVFRLFCTLNGLILGWLAAFVLDVVPEREIAHVASVAWLALPDPSFLSYSLDVTLVPPFVIACLAAALRVTGVITTCGKINDAGWTRPDYRRIRGGIVADGLGCALGGLLGAPGLSAGPSLIGVEKTTGATSRVIAWSIAGWFLVLSLLPKVSAALLAMPMAVIGAALVFSASFMIVAGIQIITSRPVTLRTTFIVGLSLLFAVSRSLFPEYYADLPAVMRPLTGSIISLAVLLSVGLNLVLMPGRRRTLIATVAADGDAQRVRDLDRVLEAQGEQLEVPRSALSRAVATVRELAEILEAGHHVRGPVTAKLSYDDLDLVVALEYDGTLPYIASEQDPGREMVEEQSFAIGLSGFLSGVFPDRMQRSSDGRRCRLRLTFFA
jgi:NCS2 family nucleobase:cation symporter-2